MSKIASGLVARRRTKAPSIKNLQTTVSKAVGIAVKKAPKLIYLGDAVSREGEANKSKKQVLKLHLESLSLQQANLVTVEGKGRSEADYAAIFKSWKLLPLHTLELNPEGAEGHNMRGVLDSLVLSLADAQPFGRTTSASSSAFASHIATPPKSLFMICFVKNAYLIC